MVCLKKSTCDELLQLALLLSLLRADPETYLRRDAHEIVGVGVESGQAWALAGPRGRDFDNRSPYVHPKNLDSELINYQQEVFEELNALGRYNRINSGTYNVTAYLLNVDGNSPDDDFSADNASSSSLIVDNERPTVSAAEDYAEPSSSGISGFPFLFDDESDPSLADAAELTQEDMDLIEVLWKQDVDLGFSLDELDPTRQQSPSKPGDSPADDDLATLKALAASNLEPRSKKDDDSEDERTSSGDDPWAGLSYTIDLETGEYVLKESLCEELSTTPATILVDEQPSSLLDLQEFSLEEALQLVGLNESSAEIAKAESPLSEPSIPVPATSSDTDGEVKKDSSEKDPLETPTSDEELGDLGDMIQTAQFHHPHPHPRAFQGRVPVVRTASVEQRWQDLANLLSLPGEGIPGHAGYPHHPHHPHHPHPHHAHISYGSSAVAGAVGGYGDAARGVLLHNATLAPPVGDLNGTGPYHGHSVGSNSNLGTAVAASMNLTNSSEPMGDAGSGASYKMESPHDMMYYQNSTTEISQTTEGFLSSILNDEDLQLMDMAMNDSMYTMRMLDATGSPSSASNAAAAAASGGAGAVAASVPGAASAAAAAAAAAAAEERMDASSDSAVSSMGSERVPSLSDGEWMETGSDSGHTAGDHYAAADYHASKYRPYDYSYSGRQHSNSVSTAETQHRVPPMAQKKHQMFGKRCFQEQGAGSASSLGSHGTTPSLPPTPVKYEFSEAVPAGGNAFGSPIEAGVAAAKAPEMKYSCSVEFTRHHSDVRPSLDHVQHNHSYHLPAESTGAMQRPLSRDKQKGRKSEDENLNRDEKRARSMNIPMTVSDIINLPMDEFNERLSKYDLSEAQLSLIRDIRRRGKNKVAAQNCRKRKLDQILTLADEVKEMRDRKNRLLQEREYVLAERQRVKEKFSQLYRHIFQALRDPEGNQYSMYEYSLQQSADGTVLLVPRGNSSALLDPEATTTAASCHKREEDKE